MPQNQFAAWRANASQTGDLLRQANSDSHSAKTKVIQAHGIAKHSSFAEYNPVLLMSILFYMQNMCKGSLETEILSISIILHSEK